MTEMSDDTVQKLRDLAEWYRGNAMVASPPRIGNQLGQDCLSLVTETTHPEPVVISAEQVEEYNELAKIGEGQCG